MVVTATETKTTVKSTFNDEFENYLKIGFKVKDAKIIIENDFKPALIKTMLEQHINIPL